MPVMLFVNNSDKPGFIGALGTMLATPRSTSPTFHLGREGAGGDAIALVGVDQIVPEAVHGEDARACRRCAMCACCNSRKRPTRWSLSWRHHGAPT